MKRSFKPMSSRDMFFTFLISALVISGVIIINYIFRTYPW